MPKHGGKSKKRKSGLPDRITGITKRDSGIPASCLVLAKYLEKGIIIQDAIINYLDEKGEKTRENFHKLMKLNRQNSYVKGNRKYCIRLAILSPPAKKDIELSRANARKYANDLKANAEKIGILITEFQEANRLKAEDQAQAEAIRKAEEEAEEEEAEKDKRIEAMMLLFFNTGSSDIKNIIYNKNDKKYLLLLSAARMCAKHRMNPCEIPNIAEIGKGAYGTVYRVQCGYLKFACKIIEKIIRENDGKDDNQASAEAKNEAEEDDDDTVVLLGRSDDPSGSTEQAAAQCSALRPLASRMLGSAPASSSISIIATETLSPFDSVVAPEAPPGGST